MANDKYKILLIIILFVIQLLLFVCFMGSRRQKHRYKCKPMVIGTQFIKMKFVTLYIKLMTHATTWINLEDIMLGEISHSQKDKHCIIIPFI